ncbi:MAG: bifunctional methylenetetrahydrofolate dehydrogenase/methenyltetrahydrofolate cyclohydrolase FolD [Clostridia bacterium]
MKIIDGVEIATKVKKDIANEIAKLNEKGINSALAVVVVGEDPASAVYVRNKEKDCLEVGIKSIKYALPETTTSEELLALVDTLNKDKNVNGILVQLPLPKTIDDKVIIENISPIKDVDAFHSENVGKIMIGDYNFLPCTPSGVMKILEYENISIEGKTCVVLGRSNIVGKPMAMLLLHANGTVTICHSKTQNLSEVTKTADILVVAIGKAQFVTGDMVKEGAVVIDVGMNRLEDGKLVGDVDFASVSPKCSYITKVPGGVGPMTRLILLENTLKATKLQNNIK